MKNIWQTEPAVVVAFVQAVIVLAISFGLKVTPEQQGAILAVIALGAGIITRSQVSPAD
jgi:hypothetical protein